MFSKPKSDAQKRGWVYWLWTWSVFESLGQSEARNCYMLPNQFGNFCFILNYCKRITLFSACYASYYFKVEYELEAKNLWWRRGRTCERAYIETLLVLTEEVMQPSGKDAPVPFVFWSLLLTLISKLIFLDQSDCAGGGVYFQCTRSSHSGFISMQHCI